jgi:heptaprenyl diphosphate synthase
MTSKKILTPPLGNALDLERKNIALLGAFCFFFSAVEYIIPKPFPFMRTGIANLPLLLALDIFPFHSFMILVAVKVLGQAMLTGILFSHIFLFSLSGTSLAAVSMYALRRLLGRYHISFIGVSVAGAMMSNISQLALAWFFLFKNNARYIAPPFLVSGLITGIVLGLFCELFTRRSAWYAARKMR